MRAIAKYSTLFAAFFQNKLQVVRTCYSCMRLAVSIQFLEGTYGA